MRTYAHISFLCVCVCIYEHAGNYSHAHKSRQKKIILLTARGEHRENKKKSSVKFINILATHDSF